MTHWKQFRLAEQDDPRIPDELTGQIILHCSGGEVLKYNVNATGRPKPRSDVVDLTEARLTGSQ